MTGCRDGGHCLRAKKFHDDGQRRGTSTRTKRTLGLLARKLYKIVPVQDAGKDRGDKNFSVECIARGDLFTYSRAEILCIGK